MRDRPTARQFATDDGTSRTDETDPIGRRGRPTLPVRGGPAAPDDADVLETGTTTLAAAGTDGVVLAADTRASLSGRFVTNRSVRKVEPIDDRTAVAFSGSVSDAQSFVRGLRSEARLYDLRHGGPASVETLATVAGDLVRRGPFRALDLLVGGVDEVPAVYDVDPAGGVVRTDYAAGGSGMQLAYGALEGAYDAELSVDELRPFAADAVRGATERDTASGDGLTLATITAEGIEFEVFDDLEEAGAAVRDGAAGDDEGVV